MVSRTLDRAIGFKPQVLEKYLKQRIPELSGRLDLERVSGGQSNPTFFLEFDEHDLVLRKQPPGKLLPSAHRIDREYRVIRALADTDVPVPEALLYCDDPGVIGTPFYVMERVDGRVFHNSAIPGVSREDRTAMYDSMNETLARLHRVDWQALGLGDFGKPGNYFARQIDRWSRQWAASRTRENPQIERLIQWLPQHIPPGDETTLCHGDFRIGNLLFHPSEPRVVALLDWELSTLGHPLADVAYNCILYHSRPEEYQGIMGLDRMALGIPAENDYLDCYYQRTGRSDGVTVFHLAFALFRFAVILEGIAARVRAGNAAADNAREVGEMSMAFARRACDLIDR